jgi:hypothetical protein
MNDIFMAKRKDEVLTRITVEHYDKRYIVESPYSDGNLIEELPELVYSILLMAGYHPDTITMELVELAKEKGYGKDEEES